MMNRRRFLGTGSVGLLAAPLVAEAQPAGKAYRIGVLASQSASTQQPRVGAFRRRLRELGYEEGRNLTIHYRWAEGDYQRLPELANELVRLKMDLIVASGGVPPALAMKAATRTIPVVFLAGDPVAAGIVPSIARPGGNLTGFDVIGGDLNAKRLELLRDALPGLTRVAVLWNPGTRARDSRPRSVELAAHALKVRVQFHEARTPGAIDTAFVAIGRERPEALLVLSDPMLDSHRAGIVDLTAGTRLPAIYQWREFAESGGLMSDGTDLSRCTGAWRATWTRSSKASDRLISPSNSHEIRAGDQSQDRQGARAHHPARAPAARRPPDRVRRSTALREPNALHQGRMEGAARPG